MVDEVVSLGRWRGVSGVSGHISNYRGVLCAVEDVEKPVIKG